MIGNNPFLAAEAALRAAGWEHGVTALSLKKYSHDRKPVARVMWDPKIGHWEVWGDAVLLEEAFRIILRANTDPTLEATQLVAGLQPPEVIGWIRSRHAQLATDTVTSISQASAESYLHADRLLMHIAALETGAPRPAVRWFALQMEERLQANDHRGGWDKRDPQSLWTWLDGKVQELRGEIKVLTIVAAFPELHEPGAVELAGQRIIRKAAGVANLAAIIADVARRCPDGPQGKGEPG